ncbi:MAG: PadR family transcriptional regulator [Acidaminobacteraceae bacterium]
MQDPILRKIFLAFIHVHILHHAEKKPIYGSWMMEEIKSHGYEISTGTLFPILHSMKKNGLLEVEDVLVEGRIRKYYSITEAGKVTLDEARGKIDEMSSDIK